MSRQFQATLCGDHLVQSNRDEVLINSVVASKLSMSDKTGQRSDRGRHSTSKA